MIALLRYAAAHGFLFAAFAGLARTAVSALSQDCATTLGIAQYGEAEFLAKLAAAGFCGRAPAAQLEHNPARMTFRARVNR